MAAKAAWWLADKLRTEKGRMLLLGIVGVLAALGYMVSALFFGVATLTTTIGTITTAFMVEDTATVTDAVRRIDDARSEVITSRMASYQERTDPNGSAYRNISFQFENGFSNNSKELLTAAALYYCQDWTIDVADLACHMARRSLSFESQTIGPYSCGGCKTRQVCDGHTDPDSREVTTYHLDDDPACDNYRSVTYCSADHYDLLVTISLTGCQEWEDDTGAMQETIAAWDTLTDGNSSTRNDTWPGWTDPDRSWAQLLYGGDWQQLYGVTITQQGYGSLQRYDAESFSGSGDFIVPLTTYSRISCHFGDPDGIDGSRHKGMDFAAAYATPILAAADGVVVTAGYHPSWGNYVKVYNGEVDGRSIHTLYAHCSSLGVSAGQSVAQGQQIAAVGSTGASTGNHLHFEVYVQGIRVNPERWL